MSIPQEQFNLNKIKNINAVEKNNIAYAAYYKDRGDGYSDVECIIRSIYNKQEYSFNANVKIPNELIKDDKPVIMPIEGGIALILPEEQEIKKTEISVLSFSTYQIDIKSDSIEITPSGEKTYLSNNAKLSDHSNQYQNYSKSRAMELSNGDILVTAIDSNSEGQYATAWFLEKEEDLKFKVNEGSKRVTNRLLFKTDSDIESDFVLLSTKDGMQIIYSDSTSLFSLDITESMINKIKDGRYINEDEECLFDVDNGEHCEQVDEKTSFSFLTTSKVSNLSAVNTRSGIVIAFLENKQLCLAKLTGKKGEKPEKHVISTFIEPIKSLQLNVGGNNVIISAIGEKSIMQNVIDPNNLSEVATKNFQIDSVGNIGDFVNIIYNQPSELTTALPFTILPTISTEISTEATTVQESTTYISTSTKDTTAQPTKTTTASTTITTKPTTIRTTQSTTTQPSTTTASTVPPTTETTVKSTQIATKPTTVTTTQSSTTTSKTTTKKVQSTTTPRDATTLSTKETTSQTTNSVNASILEKTTRDLDVTTTETSTATNAILGLTTLTSTIGSAMITTLGLVTQNTTNMLTTDNNLMITGNSSEFNQTDTSPDFEERSLNAAGISGIVVAVMILIGLILYACYRHCCRSNMRLPSDYTDDAGDNNLLQRLRSCFSETRQKDTEIALNPLGYPTCVTICENGISNNTSNSTSDLLKGGQNTGYGAINHTDNSENDADSETEQRSRSSSQISADNKLEYEDNPDTVSLQSKIVDETANNKVIISSSNSRRSSAYGASIGSNGEVLFSRCSSSSSNTDLNLAGQTICTANRNNIRYDTYVHKDNESENPSSNLEMKSVTKAQSQIGANETTV